MDTIWDVVRNRLPWTAQDESGASYARKIRKENGAVSWSRPAAELERMIRAYTPWPKTTFIVPVAGAFKRLHMTVAASEDCPQAQNVQPGTILENGRNGLLVACAEGALRIRRVIPEERQEMAIEAFLNGITLETGTVLPDYLPPSPAK